MITLTKKLSAILILVVLVVSCMAIPAMAADLRWTLDAEKPTVIEAEHLFSDMTKNPDTYPGTLPSKWKLHNGASNGCIYYNDWLTNTKIYELNVIAPYAGYYNLEYIANGPSSGLSDIAFYISGSLVDSVRTSTSYTLNPYNTDFANKDMRLYTKSAVFLADGLNVINIVISNGNAINKFAMDYIKFTPSGDVHPLAVVDFKDNTVNSSCFSLYFNKPITSIEGIAVTAQHGTAKVTVDAENAYRVVIKDIAGRTTITVPAGFAGGREDGGLSEAYTAEAFAYPVTQFDDKSYAHTYNAATREVSAYYGALGGMWEKSDAGRVIKGYIALYDGDKMVAVNQGNFNLPTTTNSSISVTHDKGVKFTTVKVFGFLEIDGELIPIGKASTRTWNGTSFVK